MLNFGAGRKRHLQVADGGVLQSSGQSQKTLTCAVITTGLDWSPQCHTAWDAGAGRSWWCLGQFYAGLLPALCCSLLINWCPGTGAARWGHASEDSSAAQHLARTCPLGGHLLQGTTMSKPLRSNWPYLLKPESHKSEPIHISPLKGTRECLRNLRKPERAISSYIYFIFSLNKGLLFFSPPTTKLTDLFIKFSKFRCQTDVFLPLLILFLAALT